VTSTLRHWMKFNAVGVVGVGIQLLALAIFRTGFKLNYLLATFLAVETTILHNFIWHERWTWADRTKSRSGVVLRLVRFNMANGLISLAGNLGLMWVFVSHFQLHYIVANLIAIIVCSIVNFVVSDRLVFRSSIL